MSKRTVYLSLLIPALCLSLQPSASPQDVAERLSPGKAYQNAYMLIRGAKAAERGGQRKEARHKYKEALGLLSGIAERHPVWNRSAIDARIAGCKNAIRKLERLSGKRRPTLKFCGAQGTLFGSCYLLDTGEKRLIIDCGLHLEPEWQSKNFDFPFDVKRADACIITHAHMDHVAKIPLLYRKGFKGPIYCSEPTRVMARTDLDIVNMLRDELVAPYGKADIKIALRRMKALEIGKWYRLGKGTMIRLRNTGHILGAVMVEVVFPWDGKEYKLLYAADTRNRLEPLTPPWETVKRADWVLIEAVYGDRLHGDFEKEFQKFTDLINGAIRSGGTVLIPTYTIARTQKVIYYLYTLWKERRLKRHIDIYVDSRIANRITADHIEQWRYLSEPIQKLFRSSVNPFDFPGMHEGQPPASKRGAKIIIAPSAMCDEGTSISKHIKKYVGDKNSVVIFTGFVLPESIGGQILAQKKRVEIDGKSYPVRCKAYRVSSFSGHADQNEIVRWFKGFEYVGIVFIVHGFTDSCVALARRLHDELGLKTYVPKYLETVDLIDFLKAPQKPFPALPAATPGTP